MKWTPLTFGRHKGKTLPQVVFTDPDWFFWCIEQGFVKGELQAQAEEIYRRATCIRIPQVGNDVLVAQYMIHPGVGKLCYVELVPEARLQHEGSTPTMRLPVLDLSLPRRVAAYDKLGCKLLVKALKYHLFGSTHYRLSKRHCEEFFNNDANFVL
jgi:hypothetical protein